MAINKTKKSEEAGEGRKPLLQHVKDMERKHYRGENIGTMVGGMENLRMRLIRNVKDPDARNKLSALTLSKEELSSIHDACQEEFAHPDDVKNEKWRSSIETKLAAFDEMFGFRGYLAERVLEQWEKKAGEELWFKLQDSNRDVSFYSILKASFENVKYLNLSDLAPA